MFSFTIPKGTDLNEFLKNNSLCVPVKGDIPDNLIFLTNMIESINIEPITTNDEPITPDDNKSMNEKYKEKLRIIKNK